VVLKYNEEFYREFNVVALNSRHHKVPYMYEDSLPSVYLTKTQSLSSLPIDQWNTNLRMGGRCERSHSQTSSVSQLVFDCADWNSLEAAVMGGRGLTAGCSAAGGME